MELALKKDDAHLPPKTVFAQSARILNMSYMTRRALF